MNDERKVRRNIWLALVGALVVLLSIAAINKINEQRKEQAAHAEIVKRAVQKSNEEHAALIAEYTLRRPALIRAAEDAMRDGHDADVVAMLAPYVRVGDDKTRALHKIAAENVARQEAKLQEQQREEARRADQARQVALAEQKSREEALVRANGPRPTKSGWDGAYYEVQYYLKENSHDPDRLKMLGCTDAAPTGKGWVTRCRYRGANMFGALIVVDGSFLIRSGTASPL